MVYEGVKQVLSKDSTPGERVVGGGNAALGSLMGLGALGAMTPKEVPSLPEYLKDPKQRTRPLTVEEINARVKYLREQQQKSNETKNNAQAQQRTGPGSGSAQEQSQRTQGTVRSSQSLVKKEVPTNVGQGVRGPLRSDQQGNGGRAGTGAGTGEREARFKELGLDPNKDYAQGGALFPEPAWAKRVRELQPALLVDGKPITGGETHADVSIFISSFASFKYPLNSFH